MRTGAVREGREDPLEELGTHLYTWVEWGNRSKFSFPRKNLPLNSWFEPGTSR